MLKRIFGTLLDEMIIFGVSVLLVLISEPILNLFGFRIVESEVFLISYYFILNVLYFPILEGGKYGTTLGKRILKLDEVELEEIQEEVKDVNIIEEANDNTMEDDNTIEETIAENVALEDKEEEKTEE